MADEWVPVQLGDVRIGDEVRTIPSVIPEGSPYRDLHSRIAGIRNGSIMVAIPDAWVIFQAHQLERKARPE